MTNVAMTEGVVGVVAAATSDRWVAVAGCALVGLLVGSFLTVVVDRVPDGRSVVRPGSACATCGQRLGPADLVPVWSWVRRRGRCRYCDAQIGPEVVAIELATSIVFALMGWRFGASLPLVPYLTLGGALVALSAIDLRTYRLPREISYTALAISFVAMVAIAVIDADWRPVRDGIIGAVIATLVLAVVFVASRGGMGSGDVRLSPLLGLHLGYLGLAFVPIGLFAGFLFGALVGIVGLATGRAGLKTGIPFGPFLAAGTLVTVWWGDTILGWLAPWYTA